MVKEASSNNRHILIVTGGGLKKAIIFPEPKTRRQANKLRDELMHEGYHARIKKMKCPVWDNAGKCLKRS